MPETKGNVSRRRFGKTLAGIGALGAAPMIIPSSALGQGPGGGQQRLAPSDRIVFGGIGIGNRGSRDLSTLLPDERVQFVAIADVRESRREAVKSTVDEHYSNNDCVMYDDAGDLLARDDIEAVLIATSDRWHACMGIWAMQAGKDIYSEKPAAMSIADSFALAENARRYGTVYQSGCQRRNGFNMEFAVGLARSGKLGRVTAVHADTSIGGGSFPPLMHDWWPEEPDPDPRVENFDDWLGPCLWRPYNSSYTSRGRSQFWDTHAGILEWCSHTIAPCQWVAESEHTHAVEYEPEGFEGNPHIPGYGYRGEYTVNGRYANGVGLVIRNHGWLGLGSCSNRFEGTEGWVETGDSQQIQVSDNLKSLLPVREGPRGDATLNHIQDFLHCIRSRSQPRANAEVTAHTHVTSHAAYIACQLGRKLEWDPARRAFVNDEEANRMRSRAYREPWRLEALAATM